MTKLNLRKSVIPTSSYQLWLCFFLFTAIVSVFVQFIFLPYVMPSWSAGSGLLKNMDSVGFHKMAVEMAEKMHSQGWSAWELRPQSQAPAGIAAIFYFLIAPKPWTLIPLNATLNASAVLVLVQIFNLFFKNTGKSLLSVLPFLIFPSSWLWTTQIHKDGYCILGVALILHSIVSLVRSENYKSGDGAFVLRSVLFSICGFMLIWLMRPYILRILQPIMALLFLLIFAVLLARLFGNSVSRRAALFTLLSMFLILLALSVVITYIPNNLKQFDYIVKVQKRQITPKVVDHFVDKRLSLEHPPSSTAPTQTLLVSPEADYMSEEEAEPIISAQAYDIEDNWKKSSWIPYFIENKFYGIAQFRRLFRTGTPDAKSNIDVTVGFDSVKSVFLYLPRAAEIVFLSPFPYQWRGQGSQPANSFMRRVSAFEMMVTYLSLVFLFYALWYWRKRIEIWLISLFCFYMLLVYGLVICNIGTLYRMRYIYMMTLVALGIAGSIVLFEQLKVKRADR